MSALDFSPHWENPFPATTPKTPSMTGAGHWDYPDYAGLLSKWMQPYEQQYSGEIQARQTQVNLNKQLAQERYGTGATSTLERIKRAEASGALRHGMTTEQAQHQHDINLRTITNSLAARGMLSSGEREYQQGEEAWRFANLGKGEQERYKQEQYGYETQRADAANQLTDYLRGIQQAFADAQRQGLAGLAQQRMSVAETLAGLYQPTWVEDPGIDAANWNPGAWGLAPGTPAPGVYPEGTTFGGPFDPHDVPFVPSGAPSPPLPPPIDVNWNPAAGGSPWRNEAVAEAARSQVPSSIGSWIRPPARSQVPSSIGSWV